MTLELKLTKIDSGLIGKNVLFRLINQPAYIYIEGGQSGSLRLACSKLPQTIKCSSKDHLKFIICGSKSDK